MDRTVAFTGQIPLAEKDFLQPQRFAMTGLSKLAEAVIGTSATVDGLWVTPTTPPSLAVRVDTGQIYTPAALDPTAYGSLPADTQHVLTKQGVLMDPLTLAVSPPGTAGYAQWYLVQVNFQERDAGAVVLPYYNADNPAEALAGPSNSGNQQYTERHGVAVVQLKVGAPAPNGTHLRPEPDPGWVGLAWVNAIQGLQTILAQHIIPYPNIPRTRVKLPQIDRAVGFNYTVVNASIQLTPEHAGVVAVDSSALSSTIDVRLPPAGSIPGVPLRMTLISRAITSQVRRGTQPIARILPATGNTTEVPLALYTNDVINLVSDGNNRWHWIGTRSQLGFVVFNAGAVSVPNSVETLVPFTGTASDLHGWWTASNPTQLTCPGDFTRVRVTAGVVWDANATGTRRARVVVNNGNRAGMAWASAPACPSGDFTALSASGGEMFLFNGDTLHLAVTQTSGGPLSIQAGLSWVSLQVIQ